MSSDALKVIYKSVELTKLRYASPAWWNKATVAYAEQPKAVYKTSTSKTFRPTTPAQHAIFMQHLPSVTFQAPANTSHTYIQSYFMLPRMVELRHFGWQATDWNIPASKCQARHVQRCRPLSVTTCGGYWRWTLLCCADELSSRSTSHLTWPYLSLIDSPTLQIWLYINYQRRRA